MQIAQVEFSICVKRAPVPRRRVPMRMFPVVGLLVAGTLLCGLPISLAADVNHGRQIARRWCTSCHVVVANQRQPTTTEAPPFATIARRADFDARRLAVFL